MNNEKILLSGKNLTKVFGYGLNKTVAVDNINFDFHEGEIISIVGESGSGKTTLAKMIIGLLKQTNGDIEYKGTARSIRTHKDKKEYWKDIQCIFQDPFSSFNIFHKVEAVLLDCIKLKGLKLSRKEQIDKMKDACNFVNLKYEELFNKYPFELSGGQMQRIMIARIVLLSPKVLIADEPTSMIDACSRATILDMLLKLRDENNMTIIFITHDVGLAYYVSDSVYIMEHGKIIEKGTADEIILNPKEAYTKQLLEDVPKIHSAWNLS